MRLREAAQLAPQYWVRGLVILSVCIQSARLIEEAHEIIKARRKRQVGFVRDDD